MKHKTRVDARTIRTKETIRGVFEAMILEMDYSDITVKEITSRAGIHRKTFYLHYECLDDLFLSLEDDIIKKLEELREKIEEDPNVSYFESIIHGFSKIIDENRELHQRLFCTESYHTIFEHIRDRACAYNHPQIPNASDMSDEELEVIYTFLTHGVLSVWRNWYMSGCQMPEAQLIKLLSLIISKGTDGL